MNEILDRLDAQNRDIENIMNMYKNAIKVGGDLQEVKNEAQVVIDGINNLKLDFLMDRRDEKSVEVLRTLENLFNENKEIIIRRKLKNRSDKI